MHQCVHGPMSLFAIVSKDGLPPRYAVMLGHNAANLPTNYGSVSSNIINIILITMTIA